MYCLLSQVGVLDIQDASGGFSRLHAVPWSFPAPLGTEREPKEGTEPPVYLGHVRTDSKKLIRALPYLGLGRSENPNLNPLISTQN